MLNFRLGIIHNSETLLIGETPRDGGVMIMAVLDIVSPHQIREKTARMIIKST